MSAFVLGSIDPLNVQHWSGFDYPERAQILPLLGDGSSGLNAVIQQSALTFREAPISGTLQSSSDVATLRGYYEAKGTSTTFTEDDGVTGHTVIVFDLVIERIFPSVWNYSARLVEVA